MSTSEEFYGKTAAGQNIDLYTMTNSNGLKVKIITFGGYVTSLQVPDNNGKSADIVLGYDSLEQYVNDSAYLGALVGRYANRIAKGKFTLKGVEYILAKNNGPNHLHGGIKGFHRVVWNAQPVKDPAGDSLKLTYLSKDGEEGFPGNLSCIAIYTLTNNDELKISYEATTDKTTIVNLTSHCYFNLAGHDSGDILSHELMVNADNYTPADETLIPTGQIAPVKGGDVDFTKPTIIGSRIAKVPGGYDHNFVLNNKKGTLGLAARVYEPKSGRIMEIYTTEPGIQFYSGNFLDGSAKGKGSVYNKHNGFCLETQHFPDSPNKPNFPSVVLNPGEKYKHLTVHKFMTK